MQTRTTENLFGLCLFLAYSQFDIFVRMNHCWTMMAHSKWVVHGWKLAKNKQPKMVCIEIKTDNGEPNTRVWMFIFVNCVRCVGHDFKTKKWDGIAFLMNRLWKRSRQKYDGPKFFIETNTEPIIELKFHTNFRSR